MKLTSIFAALGLAAAVLFPPPSVRAAERRPNFLVILGDNLGKDWFGCYGADGNPTPHIDQLAATGVRIAHCYVTPLCSTTRAMLFTGRYGFRTGWHTHHDAGFYGGGGFDWKRELTWARLLRNAGYATAIAGKWQINDLYDQRHALKEHGFDEHLVWSGALAGEGLGEQRWKASIAPGGKRIIESRYHDPVVFRNGEHQVLTGKFGPDVFLDSLIDFMRRHRQQPFLAFYSCPLVHVPTIPTPLSPDPIAPPREQFAGMVRYMDVQVDRLRQEVERLGLRDDTIIVFLTDNGTPVRLNNTMQGQPTVGGLGTLNENGLDVPLIVNCPARIASGRFCNTLVDATDLFPTLAELAGVALPTDVVLDGRSFAAQLDPQRDPPPGREWIFSQYDTTRVVRDRQFKLYSTDQLFDLSADLWERKDLAGSADAPVVAAKQRLQSVLDQLPPNTNLPFPYRSSQAFRAAENRRKANSKSPPGD